MIRWLDDLMAQLSLSYGHRPEWWVCVWQHLAVVAIMAALAGCASVPHAPKVITIPQREYVSIPPELSADCTMPTLANRTVDGAIDFAIRAKGALIECSDRMAAIRAIQGSPVK